jgi:hypothetical protein
LSNEVTLRVIGRITASTPTGPGDGELYVFARSLTFELLPRMH